MRKLYLLMSILLISIILSGCKTKDNDETTINYTFKGENEFWDAEYIINGIEKFEKKNGILSYHNNTSNLLTVEYRGDLSDLNLVKEVDISYETSTNSGRSVDTYNNKQPITSKEFKLKSEGENTALPDENEIVTVEIKVDGVSQTLELKKSDSE